MSRGVVELQWKGVYRASLIKKEKYWPKGVPGAMIEASIDGLPFQIMCMKEPNYMMKIMCKCMTLDNFERGKKTVGPSCGRRQDNQDFLL